MLYTEEAVRSNIRNLNGRRVFYLGKSDQLTTSARDYLNRERIEILSASRAKPQRYRLLSGGFLEEKPEHMTHLRGDILVPKTHPIIRFRGQIDILEGDLLLCQLKIPHLENHLEEMLQLARHLIRCDVMREELAETCLGGLTAQELRSHSHFPQDYYGQPHFMPNASDGETILLLNRLRSQVRQAELAAAEAFPDRMDIVKALNRMSSMVYILMIREKSAKG